LICERRMFIQVGAPPAPWTCVSQTVPGSHAPRREPMQTMHTQGDTRTQGVRGSGIQEARGRGDNVLFGHGIVLTVIAWQNYSGA